MPNFYLLCYCPSIIYLDMDMTELILLGQSCQYIIISEARVCMLILVECVSLFVVYSFLSALFVLPYICHNKNRC